jgi:exodeoxyribonuclease-3
MRVITLNVNGIRSAIKKGAFRWLAEQNADIICLQEVRAGSELLKETHFQLPEYHCYYNSAQKSGYSGVGILCKKEPKNVVTKLGFPLADDEGRYIHVEYDDLIVASLYMPSGTSGEARQTLKYAFMDQFLGILETYLQTNKPYIICGDWNIAHKAIDLKNWRANQKHTGFLPEEREWLDVLFDQKGFVDAFRIVNQEPDQYTWWSNFGQAWAKNVGWRIDYQITTPDLKNAVRSASIYKDERFSDHAPLVMDYAL